MTKTLLIDYIDFSVSPHVMAESINNNGKLIVSGIIQRADAVNQNGRVYPKKILEREVDKYMKSVKERRALGSLDHTDSHIIELSTVSHLITDLSWKGNDLYGIVEILPTPNGNILKELFKSGIKVGISSRGLGSVKKVEENVDQVDEDFQLICWDFVSNPSTHGAFMGPMHESTDLTNIYENKYLKINNTINHILSLINNNGI